MLRAGRRRAILAAALAAVAVVALSTSASAAIYWGNSSTIGRINNDGSFRQDGTQPGGIYIGALGEQRIANACGIAVDASYIYWGDKFHGTIGRANLDGSGASFSFILGANEPCGVAVTATHLYWANEGSATIGRAHLDGSEVRQDFVNVPEWSGPDFVAPRLCGVAVSGTHVFWSNWREDLIGRATLDGQEVTPNFISTPDYGPCGLAANATHLFWGSYGREIGRANLDGTEPDFDFISGLDRPCAVAVDASHLYWITEASTRAVGRANLDGSAVTGNLVSNLQPSCGLAVNSGSFTPPAPPPPTPLPLLPQPSFCKVEEIRHNRAQRKAIVAVRGPIVGSVELFTKGVRWRLLNANDEPLVGFSRRWWLEVRPAARGRVAKRITHRLARHGRTPIDLGVRCRGRNELPTTVTKKMTLLAVPASPRNALRHAMP